MTARVISKMLFLCRCQLVLCAIAPIWCLGLWRCITEVKGKHRGEIKDGKLYFDLPADYCAVFGDPALDMTGWCFSSHTQAHTASSSCVFCLRFGFSGHALQHAGMSAQLSFVLKRTQKNADKGQIWDRRRATGEWGNINTTMNSCDLLHWCWQYASMFSHCISMP